MGQRSSANSANKDDKNQPKSKKSSGFSLFRSSKRTPASNKVNESKPDSPRQSLLPPSAANKNRYGLARNPDYVSDSEAEDEAPALQRLDSEFENNEPVDAANEAAIMEELNQFGGDQM